MTFKHLVGKSPLKEGITIHKNFEAFFESPDSGKKREITLIYDDNKSCKVVLRRLNNIRNLRGIQCILNATHGVVGPKRKFFEAAFGKNIKEFMKLLLMPDDYIIYREDHENNGAADLICATQANNGIRSKYPNINKLLSHYKKHKSRY